MSKARGLADLGNAFDDGALSNRNMIINSGFLVNQRGVTSTTGVAGSSKFLADRWLTYCNVSDWSASIQEVTLPDGTVANSLKTVATTSAASGFFHPFQKVEAYGKDYLQGKQVTLSAWVRTNVAGQFIRICDTVNCHLIGTFIPADGQWHKVSAVHTMPTNMNMGASDFMQFQPLFNTVDLAVGDYCEFALPQMEIGDTATPFEHRSYGDELQNCQRYYYRRTSVGSSGSYYRYVTGFYSSTSAAEGVLEMPVEMRATPSLSSSGTFAAWDSIGVRSATTVAIGGDGSSKQTINLNISGISGGTQLRPVEILSSNNSSSYIELSAEL
jgi:hypothetical protein